MEELLIAICSVSLLSFPVFCSLIILEKTCTIRMRLEAYAALLKNKSASLDFSQYLTSG